MPKKSNRDEGPPPPPGVAIAVAFVVVGGRGDGAWKNLEATEVEGLSEFDGFRVWAAPRVGFVVGATKEGVKGSAVARGDPGMRETGGCGEVEARIADFESGGERELSNRRLLAGGKSTGIEPT